MLALLSVSDLPMALYNVSAILQLFLASCQSRIARELGKRGMMAHAHVV